MKKIRYIILMALCAIGMSACQDDLIENASTGGADASKPVKVDLKFGIPKSMEVEVTRVDNSNSMIRALRLYVFNGDNLMGEPQSFSVDGGGVTDAGIETDGHHYTVNATLYEGTQTVYAVANAATQNYWDDPTEQLDAAAEQGKAAFLGTMYDLFSNLLANNFLPTLTSEAIPLSGEGEVTVTNAGNNPSVTGDVKLQRPAAKIVFDIEEESTTEEGNNVTFTPQYYGVYKVAGRSYVLAAESERTAIGDEYYYNTPNDQPITRLENGIFIPENIQTGVTACTTYDDRDEVDPEQVGATDAEKSWVNAPKNATYIVIKGTYSETDAHTDNLVRQADVSYTVHLGDWSGGNYNDFSVHRNYIYTYHMTVKGVDRIVVEATAEEDSDEFQDAAEGDVIDVSDGAEVFNLDAHYEQVYVQYDLTDIANAVQEKFEEESNTERIEDLIANSFILSIHTPMNLAGASDELLRPYLGDDETGETSMANLDWKWIEMYSQENAGLSTYTAAYNDEDYPILNPWEACRKMGQAVYSLTQNSNQQPTVSGLRIASAWISGDWHYVARFTIFVDEFFYTHDLENNPVDWADFTRMDPRTFMIATDIQVSPDGNSSYATARTYISQASILTFYNRDSADDTNALGIESYNEYGLIAGFGSVDQHSYVSGGDYLSNGRANMLRNTLSSRSATSSDQGIDFTHIGYIVSNATSGHSWRVLTTNEKQNAAYKACLSRNRDLDGNGQIDDSEVHWYLPSRSQYLRMGIGANSLGDYQLYTGEKSDMTYKGYPTSYAGDGALYYSNTPNGNSSSANSWELYWAVEVGAYGSNSYGDAEGDDGAQIRCVRNLPSYAHVSDNYDPNGDDALAGPVYNVLKQLPEADGGNYIFDFGNRLDGTLYRTTVQEGPYTSHTEIDDANMLPGAFVVANEPLRGEYIEGHWEGNWPNREWVDAYYEGLTVSSGWSGGRDNPCATYYEKDDRSDRGEWRVPNLSELMVMSTVDTTIGIRGNTYLCSTQFSNPAVRSGFRYNDSLIAAWDPNSGDQRGYVRCVRDATQAERDAANNVE